ncbi:hypothetical protein HU200_023796 [Digitaria exilis]|uniref:Uncharacterized protein n=1 Tax=Digitaria exilis TaxID=1010633 RepID=A0A835C3C6_9POAL|nr:hypothetical protein HU200_023796 [Digitaria exilis]
MGGGGEGDAAGSGNNLHLVMFPWLAFGHISPFAQLARKLVSMDAGIVPRLEAMLTSATSGDGQGASNTSELSADGAELLKLAVDATSPAVRALLAELQPDAVLIDFATPWVCDAAVALGIKVLYFCVFSASAFAYTTVPARLVVDVDDGQQQSQRSPSARDLMVAPAGYPLDSVVATVPAHLGQDLMYIYTSFHGMPSVYDRVIAGVNGSAGLVMKTCHEMEGRYIDYISAQYGKKPVLLAGPVVPDPPQGELEEPWATWLSSFPDDAVVFASFGSETFLSIPATAELLLGLEATGRPFLAVLNFPKGTEDPAAELAARVPPGLEERVRGRGVVHTGWVQQQHILRHRSVGCFVNHAGFSSVVEGLVAGCRLVMLPMKLDQYFNAMLFARELGVGVEVARRDEDGWFRREDVRDAVAAAVATGGEGEGYKKWREFFTTDAMQDKFAVQFVRELKEVVRAE